MPIQLRLPEFNEPKPPTVGFSHRGKSVAKNHSADHPAAFPSSDLPGDYIRFDDSDLHIHTLRIENAVDSAFDRTPRVFLNAGTHGDEHESMHALASLVRTHALPEQFNYDVVFCANPHGYVQDTRQNAQGHDINRTFFNDRTTTSEAEKLLDFVKGNKYVFHADMHEDFEATGSYIYEDVRDFDHSVLAPAIKQDLVSQHFPLQHVDAEFDLGPVAGSNDIVHRYEPGVVLADAAAESIAFQSPGMMLTTKLLLGYRERDAAHRNRPNAHAAQPIHGTKSDRALRAPSRRRPPRTFRNAAIHRSEPRCGA